MSQIVSKSGVTISSGQSLSGAIGAFGVVQGIQMPSAWTAADLTFQISTDGGTTYQNVYTDAGVEYVVTADASRYILVDDFPYADAIKVRSGTSGTAVNQGADRSITLMVKHTD